MANRPAIITQADVKRAVKGAVAAGLSVREVIATAEGVRLICGDREERTGPRAKSWDDLIR